LYQVIPVGITVEGANILTRTMMIFGQGAIRCHPYVQKEMAALQGDNLAQFDAVLFQHIGFFLRNLSASIWLGLSNARFQPVPGNQDTRIYYRRITRLSAGFALFADFALITLGGKLKRKERPSGLFADVLSHLYLCSCVLKHYQDQGCPKDDAPLLHWACQHSLYQAQQALRAVFWKLPLRPLAWILRGLVFPLG
jgi:acyl-CoA dehydrogenase